jgi:hypothetical protein
MARFAFELAVSALFFASAMISIDTPSPARAEQPAETGDATTSASKGKTCGETFDRRSIFTEEFNRKCIALAGPLAAMRSETLVLRMDDGSRKKFDNKNSLGATVAGFGYGLADFYPSTHVFVVGDYGADTTDFTIVDGRTGHELNLGSALPQLSPNGNWILAITYSDYEGVDSDFVILDVRDKDPLKVWASRANKPPLPAKTDFVAWVEDTKVRLTSPSQKVMFLFRTDDATWHLSPTGAN